NQISMGVAWPGQVGGGTTTIAGSVPITPSGPATLNLQVNQSLPAVDVLQNNGWGRFLRHGAVVTTNGTEANFHSGGQIYVPVPGQNGLVTFQTVEFGSRIIVTPNYDASSGRVELEVSGEFSDLI